MPTYMVQLIKRGDPRFFEQTSDAPYDRHDYKVVSRDGKSVTVDSWESAHIIWWNTPTMFLSHIEVLNKSKGFQ